MRNLDGRVEEEYKEETSIIENKIKNLEKKLLENEQVSNLNLTIDDILIKRDMDFINKVKLPVYMMLSLIVGMI